VRTAIRTLLLAVVALGGSASAAQAGDWTVGEITGPPGTTRVEPTAVNASGVVVGQARFPGKTIETAFRWEDGVMIELAVPGGMSFTRASDINDAGTIVGYVGAEQPCCTAQYTINGAIWTATKMTSGVSLTPYTMYGAGFATSGPDKDRGSSLLGINGDGQVVGRAAFSWVSPFHNPNQDLSYTVFPTVGTFSRLPLPDTLNAETGGAVYGGTAYKVNNRGDIMGIAGPGYSRVWHGGGGTGTRYDVVASRQGFNDDAHIAGMTGILSGSGTEQDHRAQLWNGTEYIRIGADQPQSVANAVNNSDWAVGRAGVFYGVLPRTAGNAFLWRPDDAPTPLYALAPTGWSMANANDINDDGMIVGSGKHGNVEVGYWMAPASIAHQLGGTVYGPTGSPVAGAQLRITNAAGNELATPVTGADGTYRVTLNRGGPYDITVLPDGAYRPDGLAGCTIVGAACRLNLGKNRTVDFYGTDIVVPDLPDPGPPSVPGPGTGGAPTGGGAGGSGAGGGAARPKGPAFSVSSSNRTLTPSANGAVGVKLGTFSTAVTGTITIETAAEARAAAAVRASSKKRKKAKAKAIALGTATFKARKGQALTVKLKLSRKARAQLKRQRSVRAGAVVTAKSAEGGVTTKRYALTLKASR